MAEQVVPRVFLAHKSGDKAAAGALARALRERFGIDVWFDGWEIVGGDNFVSAMEDGVARAHGGLVFCSALGVTG